jgi:serine/threonine protein kinase
MAVPGTAEVAAMSSCMRCHVELPAGSAFCPTCGASASPDPVAGPVLDGYTVLRVLGRGGAAVVYLARQEALDRLVAVKVLRHDVEDAQAWRRFRREALAIAKLSAHPNVVTVYTAGRTASGAPYLVTEYLDRGSLSDVMAIEGPLSPDVVATVGIAVADALAAAHQLGIVHRDVKPGNVLLNRHDRVKLGDFGVVRLLGAQSVTHTDSVAFTPEHVAPEILRGEPDGPWSDVYGLASTLATGLVGTPPFIRRPGEPLDAFLCRKLTAPPTALPASLPPALAAPITRALDPKPSRRPLLHELREQLVAAADTLASVVQTRAPQGPPRAEPTLHTDSRPQLPVDRTENGPDTRPPFAHRVHTRRLWAAIVAALAAAVVTVMAAMIVRERTDHEASGERDLDVVQITAVLPTNVSTDATQAPPVLADVPSPSTPTSAVTSTTIVERAAAASITESHAETFLRSYFDAVASGNYAWSWSRLAPEFQRGKARSYDYYVGFWNDNDVEVGDVQLVDATDDRAIVSVDLLWNGNDSPVTDQFTLRVGNDGELLISEQATIG